MSASPATMMAAQLTASAGANIGSTYASAAARRSQGQFAQQQAEFNRQAAERQADDAIKRGKRDVAAMKRKTRNIIGSQRAAFAAQGIDVESGSAAEIQADTAALSAADELTIRNNSYREAFGFRSQALNFRFQGEREALATRSSIGATIATGGMRFTRDAVRIAGRKR